MLRRDGLRVGAIVGSLIVAACVGGEGVGVDEVLGYEGLGRQVELFYAQRAWERSATCTMPTIDRIIAAEVVEETEDTLVVRVGYSWSDDSRDGDSNLLIGRGSRCRSLDERRFTLRKLEGGGVRVIDMSGPQRRQPLGAVRF